MVKHGDHIEFLLSSTATWLQGAGYMKYGMNYPRRSGIKYGAKYALEKWNYCRTNSYPVDRQIALHVLALQPFSGIRPEWVEKKYPWF